MRIAVIGAGPAGLTCAKQALAAGHEVVVHEKHGDVGGIWDPAAGGAYASVRMQSSRLSFPFSDYPPRGDADFPTLAEVHAYLRGYAEEFGVLAVTRFRSEVTWVSKEDGRWSLTAQGPEGMGTESFDAVMVASGELWRPRLPGRLPEPGRGVRVITAKDYRDPAGFEGSRVLVVGGGVSGADIAAELSTTAASVDWSVRRKALFLPRYCGGSYNDALFSYAGRVALERLPYQDYLGLLGELMPDYMRAYRESGLLPEDGFHGAVHVNEKIVPLVHRGAVRVRPAFAEFDADAAVVFADGTTTAYDAVVLCLGYEMPDYGFIDGLRREDLYEHHFHRDDPTLAIINTPVDGEGFGTACPYFEAIAGWVLAVLSGKAELPDSAARAAWCAEHMGGLHRKRYLDCWLETIRIGLLSGALPDPATRFADYWRVVAGAVAPDNLRPGAARPLPAVHDAVLDLASVRHRVLAWLPGATRDRLLAEGQIDAVDHAAAAAVPPGEALAPDLPYRQRMTAGTGR